VNFPSASVRPRRVASAAAGVAAIGALRKIPEASALPGRSLNLAATTGLPAVSKTVPDKLAVRFSSWAALEAGGVVVEVAEVQRMDRTVVPTGAARCVAIQAWAELAGSAS
jgi:hypothetical protein